MSNQVPVIQPEEEKTFAQKLGNHVRGTLIVGVLILVPVAITFMLLRIVFDTVDGLLQPVIETIAGLEIPGLGLIALLLIVYLLGLIWTRRIGRRIIRTAQHYLLSVPVIGAVYGPARKLIESFSGDSGAGFKRVVVVEYPKQDTWMIGFLTGITKVTPGTMMGVLYLPTAPTPNSGWVAMIPIQQVYDTTMTVQEAMSMVLSGGISSPLQIDLKPMDPQEAVAFIEQGGTEAAAPQISSDSGVFNLPFLGDRDDENKN